jgi:hypothetical protein
MATQPLKKKEPKKFSVKGFKEILLAIRHQPCIMKLLPDSEIKV